MTLELANFVEPLWLAFYTVPPSSYPPDIVSPVHILLH